MTLGVSKDDDDEAAHVMSTFLADKLPLAKLLYFFLSVF